MGKKQFKNAWTLKIYRVLNLGGLYFFVNMNFCSRSGNFSGRIPEPAGDCCLSLKFSGQHQQLFKDWEKRKGNRLKNRISSGKGAVQIRTC